MNMPASLALRLRSAGVTLALCTCLAHAQTPDPPQPAGQTAGQTAPLKNPDASIVETATPRSTVEIREQAWALLTDSAGPRKGAEIRVQTLAALGLMGDTPRTVKLIRDSMSDKDIDIRTAAVVAAGQTRSRNLTSDLRRMLDDKEPAVAFAAALTLWKMHDPSGEDILTAVADGDRPTTAKFLDGTEHSISRQLHDPAGLARYGAMQGAYMLLGPFGMGLTAYEYLHKNGGDTARVSAIDAIAQNHTAPIRAELIAALADKDLGVRAAAAKALAHYREADVPPALARVLDDTKAPVRLTAAAAWLISTGAAVASPAEAGWTWGPAAHTPRK